MAVNVGDYLVLAKPDLLIIGVDEAGRGPLAGPVVAAACVLGTAAPAGLDDSKKLSAKRRAVLEPLIMAILGVLVGGLVIAMYLPIFKLGSVV